MYKGEDATVTEEERFHEEAKGDDAEPSGTEEEIKDYVNTNVESQFTTENQHEAALGQDQMSLAQAKLFA